MCYHEVMTEHKPYLTKRVSRTVSMYNPNYGDNRLCECGDPYHRHFDPYENWEAVGCKYCDCRKFKPSKWECS